MSRALTAGVLAAGLSLTSFAAVAADAPSPDWAAAWGGAYLGVQASYNLTNITYTNTGTPHQNLNGAMIGLQAGYDVQMDNAVLGVVADIGFGNLNDFVRDGNYITESGKINALGTVRARAGFAMGNFLPYITGGVMMGSLEQGEVCPAPAAAPFGFCNTHGPFDLKGSKFMVGGTVGAGVEVMVAPGWSMQTQYLFTAFPSQTFTLSPDGNGDPLPDSIAHPKTQQLSISFIKRY